MREPCSVKTSRASKQRHFVVRGKKRSACRYASIFWACQGEGDRARRTYTRT
jgi:hypothetical protein